MAQTDAKSSLKSYLPETFSGLKTRSFILILFVWFPALILTLVSASSEAWFASRNAQQEALRLSQLAASYQAQVVKGTEQLLVALAQLPAVYSPDQLICRPLFADLMDQYASYTNLFVVDTDGNTYCSGLSTDPSPEDVMNRVWFQQALKVGIFSQGDYAIGLISRRPVVTYSLPILNENGAFKYIVAASVDLAWVGDFISETTLPSGISITAIDRNGTILYVYPGNNNLVGQVGLDQKLTNAVLAEGIGTIAAQGLDGGEYLFGFSPLVTTGSTYVIVGMPSATVYAESNRVLLQSLIALLLVGFFTLVIAWQGTNDWFLRPLQNIINTAKRLTTGDLASRVDIKATHSTRELKTLAQAFNDMAQSLENHEKALVTEIAERKRAEAALEQARDNLDRQVQERTAQLERLQSVTSALSQAVTPEQVADIIIQKGLAATGGYLGIIALIIEDGQSLKIVDGRGLSEPSAQPDVTLSLDSNTPAAEAIRTGRAVWIKNAEAYADYREFADMVSHEGDAQSLVSLPLWAGERIIGSLTINFPSIKQFDEDERRFLLALADQCAQAMERSRLYDVERITRAEAEHTAVRLRDLQSVTSKLSQALTPLQVVEIIVQDGFAAFGGFRGLVGSISSDSTHLEVIGGHGVSKEALVNLARVPLHDNIPIIDAARTGEIVLIHSPEEYQQQYPTIVQRIPEAQESMAVAGLPLIVDKKTIGSLSISFRQPQQFTQKDIDYMLALAQQCAQALERARLSEQAQVTAALEERNRLARDLHDAVTQTLFAASTIADALPGLWERSPERVREHLSTLTRLTRGALAEMRTLLLELRPAALVNSKFSELLFQLTHAIEARKNISFSLVVDEKRALPPEIHVTLYRLAQEILNNVVKHSQASEVNILFQDRDHEVELRIRDNGIGFDPKIKPTGLGLGMMQERTQAIGAVFSISSVEGQGSEVVITWKDKAQMNSSSSEFNTESNKSST